MEKGYDIKMKYCTLILFDTKRTMIAKVAMTKKKIVIAKHRDRCA